MTDPRWERVVDLFHEAADLPPDARASHLAPLRDAEPDVHAEVQALLDAHDAASGYLDGDAVTWRAPADGTQIGPWRLAEQIGQGGMSVVYRAERIEGGYTQRAAMKLIALPNLVTREMAGVILRRFEAERQIVARLEHPDICRLLDGGITPDGVPYLVLEYVDGVDVVTYTAPLGTDARLAVLARIARAVHYAHQRLVVHRDIKPNNVLVTPDGHPKLLDFGIAKALHPASWNLPADSTTTLHRAATPAYASPEQLQGAVLTTATDVYSLGMLMRRVFSNESSPDVDAIVARATREEPSERYGSAAALADDLDRCRAGLPVEARHGNVRYVVGRFVRRHTVAVALALLALVLIIGFAVVTRVQMRRIEQERVRATQVAGFMQELFQASNPDINQGNRVTTRELLDEGARRIRQRALPGDTRDALLQTMADAYAGLGVYDQANAIYSELADRYAASDGTASPRLAAVYGRLAAGSAQLGEHEAADQWAQRAVDVAQRVEDDGVMAIALEARCRSLAHAARHGDAAPVCAQAAASVQASRLDALDRVRILRSYGESLKETGAFDEGAAVLQDALELARRATNGPHAATATTSNALGSLYFRQGNFDAAAVAFGEAIDIQRALYPDGHADLARSLNNLANTHATLRQVDTAIPLYVEAHAIYRRYLGDDHGELATSLSNLAVTQQIGGHFDGALATLTTVSEMHARATGRDKLPYWQARLKYASLQLEMGAYRDAAHTAAEVVDGLDGLEPQPAIDRGLGRIVLAASLIEDGRPRDALTPARDGRALLEAGLAPTHWMRSYADMALGGALAATGRVNDARPLLEPHYTALPPEAPERESWRAAWLRRLWTTYVAS